jgi:hypothetical protein
MKANLRIVTALFMLGSVVHRADAQSPMPARELISWEQVNSSGFGDPLTTEITALEAFNGQLYAGTYNPIDPEPLFDGGANLPFFGWSDMDSRYSTWFRQ